MLKKLYGEVKDTDLKDLDEIFYNDTEKMLEDR